MSWTCGLPSRTSPRRCWCRSTAADSATATRASAPALLDECLKSGISVVAITYRLSDEAKAPAQFLDSARAIQFIRSKAKEWNLDPSRIAATGGSAGAGISLWLGFHDDLADPKSEDPVLRQSTRLTCMAVTNGQTSYDPRFIRESVSGNRHLQGRSVGEAVRHGPEQPGPSAQGKVQAVRGMSPITHLTKDDAPVLLIYDKTMDTPITNQGIGIHHPKFGKALKEKMDALGIECQVATGVQLGNEELHKLIMDFVKRHFGMK